MLKTLMQKFMVGLLLKNFTLSVSSPLKLSIPVKNAHCILKIYTNCKLPVFRTNFLRSKSWKSLNNP